MPSSKSKARKSRTTAALESRVMPRLEANSLPMHPSLVPIFGYCFSKSALKLRKMLSEELSHFAIIPPQMGLLIILSKAGAMNQIRLGEEMHIDKATMVKLIDSLERSDLVRRKADLSDRRVKMVELTAKGKKTLPLLHRARDKAEAQFLKPLTKAEHKELQRLISKLALA